jgi:phospholipid/cholesterol/gamma-HCH transport system substrate-binding protein
MTITKEQKVGALAVISLTILYLGFNFLKGLDVFRTENEYFAYYSNVDGLQSSNPVMYNGVTIGRVIDTEIEQDKNQIKVRMAIKRDVKISDKTTAILADNGLLSGKMIKLDIEKGNPLADEGILKSGLEKGLMSGVQDKLSPVLGHADSLMIHLNTVVKQFDQTGAALKVLLTSATGAATGVNSLLASNSRSIAKVTENAASVTGNLHTLSMNLIETEKGLAPILKKTGSFADSLNAMRLGQTVALLNGSVQNLQGILKEINAGKGTLGKLAKDDSLYINLDKTAASLNLLFGDLKTNPKRYVHFSLFGRKN